MIPQNACLRLYARGFPRVSGDDPPWFTERGYEFVFSPRERG